VCGAEDLVIDADAGTVTVRGTVLRAGDIISIDGATGNVYPGAVPVRPSSVVRYFAGELAPFGEGQCGVRLSRYGRPPAFHHR
jgi:pyruvate,orthophosphate dikinase